MAQYQQPPLILPLPIDEGRKTCEEAVARCGWNVILSELNRVVCKTSGTLQIKVTISVTLAASSRLTTTVLVDGRTPAFFIGPQHRAFARDKVTELWNGISRIARTEQRLPDLPSGFSPLQWEIASLTNLGLPKSFGDISLVRVNTAIDSNYIAYLEFPSVSQASKDQIELADLLRRTHGLDNSMSSPSISDPGRPTIVLGGVVVGRSATAFCIASIDNVVVIGAGSVPSLSVSQAETNASELAVAGVNHLRSLIR